MLARKTNPSKIYSKICPHETINLVLQDPAEAGKMLVLVMEDAESEYQTAISENYQEHKHKHYANIWEYNIHYDEEKIKIYLVIKYAITLDHFKIIFI